MCDLKTCFAPNRNINHGRLFCGALPVHFKFTGAHAHNCFAFHSAITNSACLFRTRSQALPALALAENTILLDLSPEEAQKYIDGSNSFLKYAPSLGAAGPLPTDHKSYFRGAEIEKPEQFVSETYLANQFHGQNGLGQAKFGYSDWNQARVENINAHGKTEGSYQYESNGETYEVKYWADTSGFHRTDNHPLVQPEAVTDTPEVKAAILAHQKAWSEAAAANKASSAFPVQPKAAHELEQQPAASEDQYKYVHEEEPYVHDGPTGPPRGFFYNIDYPVHLISEKQ